MKKKYILFCLIILCMQPKQIFAQGLSDSSRTEVFRKEVSLSWYFGDRQFLYRKFRKMDEHKLKYTRLGVHIAGQGSFEPKELNVFSNQFNPSNLQDIKISLILGRETRTNSFGLEKLSLIRGLDFEPSYAFLNARINVLSSGATGAAVFIRSQKTNQHTFGAAVIPFFGFRYKLTERLSIASEHGFSVFLGANYRSTKDNSTLINGVLINSHAWYASYALRTLPFRAFWLSLQF